MKTNGTEMVLSLTMNEQSKLDTIQAACPLLDLHMVSRADGYLLMGYKGETDECIVRVENDSLGQAEREYRGAYEKLMRAGWLSATARRAIA